MQSLAQVLDSLVNATHGVVLGDFEMRRALQGCSTVLGTGRRLEPQAMAVVCRRCVSGSALLELGMTLTDG